RCEANRIDDEEQRRGEQDARHRDERETYPPGRGQQTLDLLRGGDDGRDVLLILVAERQGCGELGPLGLDAERLGQVTRLRGLDQRGLVGEVLLEDVVRVLLVQVLVALHLRVGPEL